jgi:hypothetical protein
VKAHRVVRGWGSHIFSRQSAHRWQWGCQPYTPAALYPQGRFLVLISVTGWDKPRAIVQLEGLGKLKKKIHLIGTGNRDLSACSIVPQRTTLLLAPARSRSILVIFPLAYVYNFIPSVNNYSTNVCTKHYKWYFHINITDTKFSKMRIDVLHK